MNAPNSPLVRRRSVRGKTLMIKNKEDLLKMAPRDANGNFASDLESGKPETNKQSSDIVEEDISNYSDVKNEIAKSEPSYHNKEFLESHEPNSNSPNSTSTSSDKEFFSTHLMLNDQALQTNYNQDVANTLYEAEQFVKEDSCISTNQIFAQNEKLDSNTVEFVPEENFHLLPSNQYYSPNSTFNHNRQSVSVSDNRFQEERVIRECELARNMSQMNINNYQNSSYYPESNSMFQESYFPEVSCSSQHSSYASYTRIQDKERTFCFAELMSAFKVIEDKAQDDPKVTFSVLKKFKEIEDDVVDDDSQEKRDFERVRFPSIRNNPFILLEKSKNSRCL